ncbi:hypothetical protein VTH82DRAFT_764 [Thermothelomyces myriococcoides]
MDKPGRVLALIEPVWEVYSTWIFCRVLGDVRLLKWRRYWEAIPAGLTAVITGIVASSSRTSSRSLR